MSFASELGKLVKARRVAAGITQEELAEIAFENGKLKFRVSEIESGKVTSREQTVVAIANALNISDLELEKLRKSAVDNQVKAELSNGPNPASYTIEAEAPKMLKHIKWFLEYGRANSL